MRRCHAEPDAGELSWKPFKGIEPRENTEKPARPSGDCKQFIPKFEPHVSDKYSRRRGAMVASRTRCRLHPHLGEACR